jgi:hypothetical protein
VRGEKSAPQRPRAPPSGRHGPQAAAIGPSRSTGRHGGDEQGRGIRAEYYEPPAATAAATTRTAAAAVTAATAFIPSSGGAPRRASSCGRWEIAPASGRPESGWIAGLPVDAVEGWYSPPPQAPPFGRRASQAARTSGPAAATARPDRAGAN